MHCAHIGFLPDYHTSDHLFTLRTLIDKHVTHTTKAKLFTCFIDFKKAFDSILHDGLFYKLLKYNFGGKFHKSMKIFIQNHKAPLNLDIIEQTILITETVIHLEIESTEPWDSLGHLSMSPRPTIVSPRAKYLIRISKKV